MTVVNCSDAEFREKLALRIFSEPEVLEELKANGASDSWVKARTRDYWNMIDIITQARKE